MDCVFDAKCVLFYYCLGQWSIRKNVHKIEIRERMGVFFSFEFFFGRMHWNSSSLISNSNYRLTESNRVKRGDEREKNIAGKHWGY